MSAADFKQIRDSLVAGGSTAERRHALVAAGGSPLLGLAALDRIEALQGELVATLENTPCFGCGVRYGDDSHQSTRRGCVNCTSARASLAKARGGDPA